MQVPCLLEQPVQLAAICATLSRMFQGANGDPFSKNAVQDCYREGAAEAEKAASALKQENGAVDEWLSALCEQYALAVYKTLPNDTLPKSMVQIGIESIENPVAYVLAYKTGRTLCVVGRDGSLYHLIDPATARIQSERDAMAYARQQQANGFTLYGIGKAEEKKKKTKKPAARRPSSGKRRKVSAVKQEQK